MQGMTGMSGMSGMVSGGNPNYNAWLSRVIALGATPPTATKTAVAAFYAALAAAGFVMADFDYMYLMIGENSGDTSANKYNQKRVNLASPGTLDAVITNPNASGHSGSGTVGNNSMYWNSGYSSSTMTVDRKDNASWGVITTSAPSQNNAFTSMGIQTSGHYIRAGYGDRRWAAYGNPDSYTAIAAQTFPKLYYAQTTGAAGSDLYDGVTPIAWQVETGSVPASLGANPFFVFGTNNGGSPNQLTDETIAFAWHGRGLSTGERSSWYSMLQTLMAAFSVTI